MKKDIIDLGIKSKLKGILFYIVFMITTLSVNAQSCSEIMSSIKSNYYGTTYYSPTSDAIAQVTFYEATIEYNTYYFAIVKHKDSYTAKDYLYQVASNTKLNYAMNYLQSAGKAFHKYIKPYSGECGKY